MGRRKQFDADLHWYFNDAESELGARAQAFEPHSRTTSMIYGNSPQQAKAASRYARIDERLRKLPEHQIQVLMRWYARGHYPEQVRSEFGPYAGVAMLTRGLVRFAAEENVSDSDALREVSRRAYYLCPDTKLIRKCRDNGHHCRVIRNAAKDLIKSMKLQVERIVEAAHDAYGFTSSRDDDQAAFQKKLRMDILLGVLK